MTTKTIRQRFAAAARDNPNVMPWPMLIDMKTGKVRPATNEEALKYADEPTIVIGKDGKRRTVPRIPK